MGSDPSRVSRGTNPIRRRLQHPTSVPLHQPARNSWGSPKFEAQPHCTSPWSNPKPAQLETQTQTPNSCQPMHGGSDDDDDESRGLRLNAPRRAAVPIPPAAPLASSPPCSSPNVPLGHRAAGITGCWVLSPAQGVLSGQRCWENGCSPHPDRYKRHCPAARR